MEPRSTIAGPPARCVERLHEIVENGPRNLIFAQFVADQQGGGGHDAGTGGHVERADKEVVVQPGDTLWGIAEAVLGDGAVVHRRHVGVHRGHRGGDDRRRGTTISRFSCSRMMV